MIPPAAASLEHHARPGETLRLAPDTLWFLAEGEVVVHCADRPVEVWRAPRPLDLAGAVRGAPHARFVAATPARAVGVRLTEADPALVRDALAREASGLWDRVATDVRRDDSTFLAWGVPVPGPWRFADVRGVVLAVDGDPARVRESLPRGVRPLCGGRFLLGLTRLAGAASRDPRDTRAFTYREITPFVPVLGPGGPAAFVPELYVDAWMAMVLGREIHGFPKRTGRIDVRDDGADLVIDGRLALRVRYTVGEPIAVGTVVEGLVGHLAPSRRLSALAGRLAERWNAAERGARLPVLVHKRIGDPRVAGARFERETLVRVPFRFDPIREARAVAITAAELDVGPGVVHGVVRAAWRLDTAFEFGAGTPA
ncbi:MAG: acetoacetate decarboxylase family protein [Myxococcota bacterium]